MSAHDRYWIAASGKLLRFRTDSAHYGSLPAIKLGTSGGHEESNSKLYISGLGHVTSRLSRAGPLLPRALVRAQATTRDDYITCHASDSANVASPAAAAAPLLELR
ncbi:hypothetical protein J6590_011276 [Homalodisca vitripennis]|nr:hypothetical protein J6590_011276 [Homalodisca vitripennis]